MNKQLLTIAALFAVSIASAQVGVNTNTPTSTLDIVAKNPTGTTTLPEGLLIPRIDRERAASMSGVPTSTMIYVNALSGTAAGTAVNIDAVGFYYYNGTAWVKMNSGNNTNIYSTDGALAGNRIVSQNANTLAFTGTAANAFSVDGSTFSVDAANNRIGLGTSSPNSRLDIRGGGGSDDDINLWSNADNIGTGSLYYTKSRGTFLAPTAVQTGDFLGSQIYAGHDGTSYVNTANISVITNGTIGTNSVPTDMYFSAGSSSAVERMRIASTGNVGIATAAPASTLDIAAKNATGTTTGVDGLLIPRVDRQRAASMASVPTSTIIYVNALPTSTQTGTAANIDTVGFYYFDGSAWQKMGAMTANNGLTAASNTVQLGGNLVQNTTVTNNGHNLAVAGSAYTTTFASNGFVGVGTNTPTEPLHVVGSAKIGRPGVNSLYLDGVNGLIPYSNNGLVTSSIKDGGLIYGEHTLSLGIRDSGQVNILSGGSDFATDKILDTTVANFQANGKVGIGTDAPVSTVDIRAVNPTGTSTVVDGLLIPRVDRQRAASMASVPTSTMIYVNALPASTQTGTAANIDTVGFYYFDGTLWQKMVQASSAANYQNIRGNVRDVTATTYTVQPDDYLIVTRGTATTVTFPALTTSAADIGRTVMVFNYNNNSTTGTANTLVGVTGSLTGNNGGRTLSATWTGSLWVVISAT